MRESAPSNVTSLDDDVKIFVVLFHRPNLYVFRVTVYYYLTFKVYERAVLQSRAGCHLNSQTSPSRYFPNLEMSCNCLIAESTFSENWDIHASLYKSVIMWGFQKRSNYTQYFLPSIQSLKRIQELVFFFNSKISIVVFQHSHTVLTSVLFTA